MTHTGHRTETCRCGNVIRTCRCMNPDKPTVVICQSCSACVGGKKDKVAAEAEYVAALEAVVDRARDVAGTPWSTFDPTPIIPPLVALRSAVVRLDAARKARK